MTALYEELIVDIPDYPTEGVVFKSPQSLRIRRRFRRSSTALQRTSPS